CARGIQRIQLLDFW
nr:immunoglobulin heavy chain junction region [Macaca mulatta]MOV47491.1 immunoglobulin heavy chain junction region [Macaca mulatta]MOV47553.1 immunoglobulin heavy chain junction region [Macaca mulatta]MOV48445.1 immunoglobulin heavy chain junction region [Macaca mulatta]